MASRGGAVFVLLPGAVSSDVAWEVCFTRPSFLPLPSKLLQDKSKKHSMQVPVLGCLEKEMANKHTEREGGKETRQGQYRCRRRRWQTARPPVLAWNCKSSGSVRWASKSPFVRLVWRSACAHTHLHMSARYANVPGTRRKKRLICHRHV
jgi:hypothetical protein